LRISILTIAFSALLLADSLAVEPSEILDDPRHESRARELSKALRCVVCQNQSIDDSDAALARDMRILVRERITAGDSNEEVLDYVVLRYGDFVLLKPPFKKTTLVLWLGPILMFGMALLGALLFFRRQKSATSLMKCDPSAELDETERKRLNALLGGQKK